ncbi:MAG: beta-1,6-N-acetylglucosaminyltransferase [Bacteroidales bacterium]|nr:beta-1,6-N-acetylglucosaminyltransferase [Bacteroidales bacterium]
MKAEQDELKVETAIPKQVTIAYFILVHRFPEQFKRLFKAIYHPENYYLIHLDKKTGVEIYEDIEEFLIDFPNTYILESENVVWGGYSMVQAELNGIKYLLNLNVEWDFFINLSGQDYPLKSQKIIREYLSQNHGNSFIKIANQLSVRPETMNRIENYFLETENGFLGAPYKRAYLKDVIPYIGGQWMILTRECCEFICNSGEAKKFEDYYLNTLIADESFFQTVLMNTSFEGKLTNDDKRAIIWIPDIGIKLRSKTFTESDTKSLIASGKIKLRPKTFTDEDIDFLLEGDNLFARKFDDNIDENIIDNMEVSFYLPLNLPIS